MTTPNDPPTDPAANQPADEPALSHRAQLDDLLVMAMELTRAVHARSLVIAATAEPGEDPTVPFERIARTVRRTVALAHHIDTAQPRTRPQALPLGPSATSPDRASLRRQVIRDVEDTIHRLAAQADRDDLRAELVERLERPEFEQELASRPVGSIIREICHDLGLADMPFGKPPLRRTPADLAHLDALARKPPSRGAPPAPGHPDPANLDPERLFRLLAAAS